MIFNRKSCYISVIIKALSTTLMNTKNVIKTTPLSVMTLSHKRGKSKKSRKNVQ